MINHNNFYRSLAKKGGTLTLSSNYQPSIGEVGSASGVLWERALGEGAEGGALPRSRGVEYYLKCFEKMMLLLRY